MTQKEIQDAICAILFVCAEPIEVLSFSQAFDVDICEVQNAIDTLIAKKEQEADGILLKKTGEKVYLCTNPKYSALVKSIANPIKKELLPNSVIETLSIIAYKQPVTRGDIEAIRGVRSNYPVSTLLSIGLIRENGKKDILGKPTLLETTEDFLQHFGIASLEELPLINFEEYEQTEEQVSEI